jgi:hypothetical protein
MTDKCLLCEDQLIETNENIFEKILRWIFEFKIISVSIDSPPLRAFGEGFLFVGINLNIFDYTISDGKYG